MEDRSGANANPSVALHQRYSHSEHSEISCSYTRLHYIYEDCESSNFAAVNAGAHQRDTVLLAVPLVVAQLLFTDPLETKIHTTKVMKGTVTVKIQPTIPMDADDKQYESDSAETWSYVDGQLVVVRALEQTVPAGKVEEAVFASPQFEKNTEKRGSRFNDAGILEAASRTRSPCRVIAKVFFSIYLRSSRKTVRCVSQDVGR